MTIKHTLAPTSLFSTVIYTLDRSDFLEPAKTVATDALDAIKKVQELNETYPAVMSPSIGGDARIAEFEQFIAQSSWSILDSQGYDVNNLGAYVSEMFAQEHYKNSSMDQHVHAEGSLLSGFYFLDVPEGGSVVQLHDPRAGKVQSSLKLKDPMVVSESSNSIFIKPVAGLFVFTNSWLPHSFTRNTSNEPCRFIHFNISIRAVPASTQPVIETVVV